MPSEVGTYQSNYTGGQVDAAISAIGAAPDIYLTVAQYDADIKKISGAVESFSKFVGTYQKHFSEWDTKLNTLWNGWDTSNQSLETYVNSHWTAMGYDYNSNSITDNGLLDQKIRQSVADQGDLLNAHITQWWGPKGKVTNYTTYIQNLDPGNGKKYGVVGYTEITETEITEPEITE